MTKVSKRILNKTLENYIFELFIQTIANLKDKNEIQNFIKDLLSPPEQIMLVKRLAIAILLQKGYTYTQIDNTLKVSRTTIMNVSYWLKHGNSGYNKAVEKVMQNVRKEEFFDAIEEILLQLTPPKRLDSYAYEQKQKAGKALFKRKAKRALL
ncbi:MAG: hypothetical protein HYT83_02325 [Candidatus Levybacteria bacterium]|nr:hypothetical protein [Candidatus Levybacteria bacterium]